jgi:hypothetical protein
MTPEEQAANPINFVIPPRILVGAVGAWPLCRPTKDHLQHGKSFDDGLRDKEILKIRILKDSRR